MKETVRYLAGIAGSSGYGSRSTAEQVTLDFSCSLTSHLTAIITGATSGIGAETARVLAKRGLRVVMAARNMKKAREVKANITNENPNAEVIVMEIDLSSIASVRRFGSEFSGLGLPLNILTNNAGLYNTNLEFSQDEIEMTFATNYLEMLLELMVKTANETGVQGRIVNVSSMVHSWLKRDFVFNDMLNGSNYSALHAYAQSKLANILHAKEMARRLRARNANVIINAVHPGIVKTGMLKGKGIMTDSFFFVVSILLKSISQAASTTCYVALSPQIEGVTGKYFADCNETPCSSLASDESEAEKLWDNTHALLIHKNIQPHQAVLYGDDMPC